MAEPASPDHRATVEIKNRLGLHARAAVQLVQAVASLDAGVVLEKDGQSVNGRSIMGIMMLAAPQGSLVEVSTSGPQAAEAMDAIRALVEARFNEPE
jgi:phosphocarrier protein